MLASLLGVCLHAMLGGGAVRRGIGRGTDAYASENMSTITIAMANLALVMFNGVCVR